VTSITTDFALVIDGRSLIAPCFELTFYLENLDAASVLDFWERSLVVFGHPEELFYNTGKSPAARKTTEIRGALETWCERSRVGKSYWAHMQPSNPKQGCCPTSLTVNLNLQPTIAESMLEQERDRRRALYEQGGCVFMPPITSLRITLPLSHSMMKEENQLFAWCWEFQAAHSNMLGTGHAGIALSFDEGVSSPALLREMESNLAGLLAQYPGLGWEYASAVNRKILAYEKQSVEFVARLKRVAWLVFLGPRTFQWLDSKNNFLSDLQKNKIAFDLRQDNGLVIRSVPSPHESTVKFDQLPKAYFAIAQRLAPIRLAEHIGMGAKLNEDVAQRWLETFDR
jgi:Protein of unknown function (DUF3396)